MTRSLLTHIYKEVCAKMAVKLSEVEDLTLMTDMSSSSCKTESYLEVTAYYVTIGLTNGISLADCGRLFLRFLVG